MCVCVWVFQCVMYNIVVIFLVLVLSCFYMVYCKSNFSNEKRLSEFESEF